MHRLDYIDTLGKDLIANVSDKILADRYLYEGETRKDMYERIAIAFSDDDAHAARLMQYMDRLWFMPSTPILSSGMPKFARNINHQDRPMRGLPISCFLNEVEDSIESISSIWNENVFLASSGGGIGTHWGNVRSLGEGVSNRGVTSGVIPFIKVMDSMTLAISQGSLRRGSSAVYLDVWHPEIEEFLDIRKPSGGDLNRKSLNIHHGVVINDAFMHAVKAGKSFDLLSPSTKKPVRTVDARSLFQKILETRLATGEPYMIFIDNANKRQGNINKIYEKLGLNINMSNLCSEIFLNTGRDHLGNKRTAVCCLSSLNLVTYDQWHDDTLFIEDIFRMLDNVITYFCKNATSHIKDAVYSAGRERSVGLGVMGLHSYFQSKGMHFDGPIAKTWNMKFFKYLRAEADRVSAKLADERSPCPDAKDANIHERFTNKLAIAPTASISLIAGCASPCVEPVNANIYSHKTLSGTFTVKNVYLAAILKYDYGIQDIDSVWGDVIEAGGSVQNLSFMNEYDKRTFRTAMEVDNGAIVSMANDRAPYICQGQSINLFLHSSISKDMLLKLHWAAWEGGLKSLYYCRSRSLIQADFLKLTGERDENVKYMVAVADDDCAACQ